MKPSERLERFNRALAGIMFALVVAAVLLPTPAQAQNWFGTALTSAARTTTTSSADLDNPNARGVHVIVNVSSYVSGTWTPIVQAKNPATAAYYTLLTGTGITGTGVTVLKVYPGLVAASNVANDVVPKTWRITMSGGSTPVATFSVGYFTIE